MKVIMVYLFLLLLSICGMVAIWDYSILPAIEQYYKEQIKCPGHGQ